MAAVTQKIQSLAVQCPLSLDAGATIWFLSRFGSEVFPGVSAAELVIWKGSSSPDEFSPEELEEKGILPINCGRGRLDHHPQREKPGDCAFTLCLEILGHKGDQRFKKFSEYVLWDDTRSELSMNGSPDEEERSFTIARFFKDYQAEGMRICENDQDRMLVMQMALERLFDDLDLYRSMQDRFFSVGAESYREALTQRVFGQNGSYVMVVGENDFDEFPRYARSHYGCQAAVVVHRRPSGNVQITGNSHYSLDMGGLAKMIREAELKILQQSVPDKPPLTDEGMHPSVPQWYFMPSKGPDGASMLLNGTARHRDIVPTVIPLGQLTTLTKEWLKTQ